MCDGLGINIDVFPCISDDDCQMCSDPQFDNQTGVPQMRMVQPQAIYGVVVV